LQLGQLLMQRNKVTYNKGLTLIELLVVIAILGILGVIAVPNIKSYLTERQLRDDVYKILVLIDEVKSKVYSGEYPMAQVYFNSNSGNGLIVNTKFKDNTKFLSNKACDNSSGSWSKTDTGSFADLKVSNTNSLCISRDGRYPGSLPKSKTALGSYNELNICLKSSISGAYCQGTENPGYKITWNRHGNTELYSYNGQTGWILQKK